MAKVQRQVRTPNGEVLTVNVEESWDAAQIRSALEQKGVLEPELSEQELQKQTKGRSFKPEELGVVDKVGSMLSDFGTALKVHGSSIPQSAFRLLQPSKVLNFKGDGFVDAKSEEGRKLVDIRRKAYEEAVHAPSEDELISTVANVTSVLFDPTLIAAGAASMPARLAKGTKLSSSAKAVKQITRMGKIFAGGAGIVGAIDGLDKLAEDGEIKDPQELLTNMAIGGAAGVVLDRAIAGLGAIFSKKGMTPKKADKLVTKIEDKAAELRGEGLNPSVAAQKAFIDNGIPDSSTLRSIEELAKRRIDFAKNFADVKQSLPERIAKGIGLNRITLPEGLEKLVTPISTRIGDISTKVLSGLRKFELDSHVMAQTFKQRVMPFMNLYSRQFRKGERGFRALSKDEKFALKRAVLNGDESAVLGSSSKTGTAISDAYKTARKTLDDMFDILKSEGFEVNKQANFFPRLVKDMDGLLDKLGKRKGSKLQDALKEATKRKQNKLISAAQNKKISLNQDDIAKVQLTLQEQADVVNKFLRGFQPKVGSVPGALKARKIDEIPDELLDFYADPVESLVNYIDTVTHSVAKHRFFGMNKGAAKGKQLFDDSTESIGDLVAEELALGNIRFRDADKLQSLLQSRFIGGERVASRFVQNAKNIFYSSVLGQPTSAATQLGDLGISAYTNGLMNTIKGVFGKKLLRVDELGIANKIVEEFGSSVKTAKVLNNVLKVSGFKTVDRLGKTANINGAIHKGMSQVALKGGKIKNDKAYNAFIQKWKPVFGDKTDDLVQSLQTGKIDDNVKLMAWNTLSDVQPITLSEMPQAYLNAPGGRIFYSLMSFTIKQLDIMRRTAIRDMLAGKPKGFLNMARFGMMFTAANMSATSIKDWMRGRDVPMDHVFIDSLYRNFGMSEYLVNQFGRKGFASTASGMFTPPVIGAPLQEVDQITRVIQGGGDLGQMANSVSDKIPLVGNLYYNWFGGGIERFEDFQKKQEKQRRKER